MKQHILIYDSGMGGLSVLLECVKLLPRFSYVYFSDSKNAPYGNLSKKQIVKIAIENIKKLKEKFDIKLVVLACNTMTTTAIDILRKTFEDILFVGTEPCIKLAKDLGYKKVLVVSTKATQKNSKVIKTYKSKNDIIVGDKNLAMMIENNADNIYRLLPYISKNYNRYKGKIDCVVLGCTHYVFVKKLFERVFDCPVLDSGKYVARRVGVLANKLEIEPFGDIIFCDSGGNRQFFRFFNKIALYTSSKYVIIEV